MGAANLTAIKDRIAELAIVPKPKARTAVGRNRRHPRKQNQNQNTVAAAKAAASALIATSSRYSIVRLAALLTALCLAAVSGFFSIVGLTTIFLGSFWAVVAMGTAFECAKISAVALLAQHHVASRPLKSAIVALIAALMALNVVGAYGFLARAQISHAVAGEALIGDRAARIAAQKQVAAASMADIDRRIGQIDSAIAEATKRGRTTAAVTLAERQDERRGAMVAQRASVVRALASNEIEGARIDHERAERAADFGPVEYLSKLIGADRDAAMRWFIVLVACLLDPAALMLLVAASAPAKAIKSAAARVA